MSRRDLAHNRYVWLAVGGMFLLIGIGAELIAQFSASDFALRQEIFGGAMILFGLAMLRRHPPAMEDRFNHVLLVVVYLATGCAAWAFQPGGGAAVAGGLFIGPLTAVRLQNRRHIVFHLAAATAVLLIVAASTLVDRVTIVSILVMLMAMWVLGGACTVILEASEEQGEELERLVRRDPLTGLGNRRLQDEQLAEEIRRHGVSGQQLSVIAMDLNGFKALNDTLGHAAGDELLRDVATALTRATRPQDTVIRQGGDEFLILLPNTSPDHATRTANAIRAGLASADTGGLVNSGMGIATYPDDALVADVLLHVADERLIANKADGPKRGVLPVERVDPFALPAEAATGQARSKD